jgi:urea transport system permease protein
VEPTAPRLAAVPAAREARAAAPKSRPTRRTVVFPPPKHRLAEGIAFLTVAVVLLVGLPALNALGRPTEGAAAAWHWLSDVQLNLLGRYLAYALLALGLDLIWGYTGILSLCHALFFCLGGYCMGMYLSLQTGAEGVYESTLPDFMVWNRVTELPLFWKPFHSFWFTVVAVVAIPALFALVFGFLTFRSRVRGVYFAVLTQALAYSMWLLFNRNSMDLGGTNGLTNFKKITPTFFGHAVTLRLADPAVQRRLFVLTALFLLAAYLLCRLITRSRLGRVLTAIRDNENRVRFSGYNPANFKLFVFVVSAAFAGVAGALYVPQTGIITPGKMSVAASIEMVIWVAVGGRGTLVGAALGSLVVNGAYSYCTTHFAAEWPYVLGVLFIAVVMLIPGGIVGLPAQVRTALNRRRWIQEDDQPG